MAEAGPSTSAATSQRDTTPSATSAPTSSSTSAATAPPRHSRIHFPQDRDHGKFGTTRSHSSAELATLGLGRPSLLSRRVTPGTEGNGSAAATNVRNGSEDTRPRVKSVDVHFGHAGSMSLGGHGGHGVSVGPVPGSSRLRTRSEFIGDARKATSGVRKSNRKDKMRADAPDVAASYLTPATSFSDEYDLGMSLLTLYFKYSLMLYFSPRRHVYALSKSSNPHSQVLTFRSPNNRRRPTCY